MREGSWITNAASITQYPNWAAGQPDNAGISAEAETSLIKGEDCVFQRDDGSWEDTSCTGSAEYSWACTDGYTWKVTKTQGRVQNFADGHKQCFEEYGSTFVFAVPLSRDDEIKLDFARLLAEKERGSAIHRVWLNITDGGSEDNVGGIGSGSEFRKNLPFTNWNSPYPGEEPQNLCVFKTSVSGGNNPWRTANCTAEAAHYACFDGSSWKVATSKGALVNGTLQVVPQAGVDYWSYERGNRMCKDQYGQQFYFSAPVTAAEELALDAAIRNSSAQVKSTWLNYYYVSEITSANNRWFADRLKLGIWQKPVFDNYNNSDCALLDSSGNWTDVPCGSNYAYACFNGSWSITGLSGNWENGFAACQDQNNSLFAVPRTPDEMNALISAMSGQPVWINMSDTALESQWIANRLRYAWWADNEPSNISNRDCARMNTAGQWYAAKCSVEMAPFACRKVTGANTEWFVTAASGTWSQGFATCALEYPGSEFFAPHGYGSHSATMDQTLLSSVVTAGGKDVWLNLSDQEVEGNWRPYQVYGDWAVDSLLDQDRDCAYFDRITQGSGTWYADSCKYTSATPVSRGFACTNGYEWRIVNSAATTNMRWSEGFTACDTLDTADENWTFAAPSDAVQNAKLKLALDLSDLGQVWINAQDRVDEGNWTVNGAETNFPVLADTTATSLIVPEQSVGVVLSAALADDEEVGIASAQWTLVADSRFSNVADSDVVISNNQLVTGAAGTGTVTAQYTAPALLQQDAILTFRLTVTDIPPGTATAVTAEYFVNVRVKAPILAHYDFNDSTAPEKDVSGNGHNALHTVANPLPAVAAGALSLTAADVMVVPGLAANPAGGLDIPATEYTVAYRISIEQAAAGNWRGILQKGDAGLDRQPAMFLFPDSESLHSTNTTTGDSNRAANKLNIPFQQWLNVIYSKRADGFDVYIDEELVASYDFVGGETSVVNSGNLYVGAIPGAAESFTGLIDDIQIYNRVLTATERGEILPTPPLGQVQFASAGSVVDEYATAPGNTVSIALERTRGSKAPLTVYVDLNAANSSAELGQQADMTDATNAADLAFGISYVAGTGFPVTWPADSKGQQNFVVTLDNADDTLREGTEIARFNVVNAGGAAVGTPAVYALRLTDLTPNPYGNFSVTAPDPNIVLENNSATQQICINRESGSVGEVTVNYQISGTAVAGADVSTGDYQFLGSGIVPVGNSGSVVFADGDGVSKCFDIQVFDNPAIGTADKSVVVDINGLNFDAGSGIDPILTAQNQAQMIIRDYEPGEFAFAATSFTCKEPNTSVTVPAELKPTTAELTCEVTVTRSNTSIYAPSATLDISAVPTSVADYSYTAQLVWPEITPATPATFATENQTITFNIVNDDVQENNETIVLSLLATGGENIVGGSSTLTLVDVTSPAVLTIEANSVTTYEGQMLNVNLTRDGNPNTEFTVVKNVEVLNKLFGKADSDYLSFGYSDPADQSSVLSYSNAVSVPESNLLKIRTKDVTFNGTDDYTVRVTLSDATPGRVLGLGSIGNANKDAGVNQTYRDYVISNDVSVNDLITITQAAVNDNATSVAGTYYPIDNYLGNPGQVLVTFVLPDRADSNKKHAIISYEWQLTNANGATLSGTTSGSFAYSDGMTAADRTRSITINLPFTYEGDVNSLLTLHLWGGPTALISDADEVLDAPVEIITTPRWRRLVFAGTRCVAWDSVDSRYEANNCNTSASSGELWTYDPVGDRMINKGDDACATGTGDLDKTDCNGSPTGWVLVASGSSMVVKVNSSGEKWCRMSTNQRINVRNFLDDALICSGSDDLFVWGADQ